jgi:hypothetical protein
MLITLASGGGPRCAANRRGTPGVGVIIAPAGQLKDARTVVATGSARAHAQRAVIPDPAHRWAAAVVVAASSAIVGSPSFCPGTSNNVARPVQLTAEIRRRRRSMKFGGQSLGNFLRLARVGIDFLSDPAQGRLVHGPFQFCSC